VEHDLKLELSHILHTSQILETIERKFQPDPHFLKPQLPDIGDIVIGAHPKVMEEQKGEEEDDDEEFFDALDVFDPEVLRLLNLDENLQIVNKDEGKKESASI